MIVFARYKRAYGAFQASGTQQVKEPTEFTTTRVEVEGFYWTNSKNAQGSHVFTLRFLGVGNSDFTFRSVTAVPRPPSQLEILTELQKLVDRPIPCGILCGGGDHEKVALEIEWDAVPKQLKGMLFYDSDTYTVYLPL